MCTVLPRQTVFMHVQSVRVLVAEDNLINQMVAKKMLAALGATVSVVNNGQER